MSILFKAIIIVVIAAVVAEGEPPKITQHPIDMEVVRNEPVTLNCRASGTPEPTVEWFRADTGEPVRTAVNDPISSSHRILLPDGSLFFLSARHNRKEQDSGVYYCVASNSLGVVRSKNVTLQVAYMKDEFRAVPRDTDVILGESLVLECSPPKGDPEPVVKWKKDGESIDLTSDKRIKIDAGGNLVIFDAVKSDEGRYQCSAENVASLRLSKPVRVRINESPTFVTKPKSKSALSGQDVLIACQAAGDPHPEIIWTRAEGGDIDLNRVKIIPGKGIRFENVRPDDKGTYVCTAKNSAGWTTASANLTVSEAPMMKVRPEASVQIAVDIERIVSLDCVVSGNPSPVVFWTKEVAGEAGKVFFPGDVKGTVSVSTSSNSLVIQQPKVEDGGHYACFGVNSVGSVTSRSHLFAYDTEDFHTLHHSNVYHEEEGLALEVSEARLSLSTAKTVVKRVSAESPTSIKVSWAVDNADYVDGFRVWFKAAERAVNEFSFVDVTHPEASSFVIQRVKEYTSYDVFVQPFYAGGVFGSPSEMRTVETHQDEPATAPLIVDAKLLNATTIFLAWEPILAEDANGPLKGYEIVIRGNDTSVNNTVGADINEVTLFVRGMLPNRIYTIEISAVNDEGRGPFSAPLEISFEDEIENGFDERAADSTRKMTLVFIAVGGSTFFLLVLSAAIFFYKRKMNGGDTRKQLRYLEAASNEEFLPYSDRRPQQHPRMVSDERLAANLWIDKQWKPRNVEMPEMEEEILFEDKESNSSEKKLLPQSNSNSDSEYTYVDRVNNAGGGCSISASTSCSSSKTQPEPYASTDIFIKRSPEYNPYLRPDVVNAVVNHYEAPYFHNNARPNEYASVNNNNNNNSSSGSNRGHHHRGASCDDLSRSRKRNNDGSGGRRNRTIVKQQQQQQQRPANLMDILPPPPCYPPPPPTTTAATAKNMFAASQESVISPKFLFQHPVYQSNLAGLRAAASSQHHGGSFNNKPRFARERSFEQIDQDLENELQIFNDEITKFNRSLDEQVRKGSKKRRGEKVIIKQQEAEEESSSCEADFEDNNSIEFKNRH